MTTTILLVDPSDADAAVLASALRVEGFDVITQSTADGAREALAAQPVALTIIDLMLRGGGGGGTGLDLARDVHADHPATRVLLTSAYHLSERQLARAASGVSGFIPKPYDLREVVDFVTAKLSGPPSSRTIWCAEPSSGVSRRRAPSGAVEDEPAAQRG